MGAALTCLMVATIENQEEVVDLLLAEPSTEVNAKDNSNSTTLHYACSNGNVAILGKLLAIPGILANEKNNNARTPIMNAIFKGNTDAVRMMAVIEEVDLDARTKFGWSLEDLDRR